MLRTVTTLKQQILDRDLRITKLEAELEIIRAETPSTSNILATIESEKLTASKAMSQNQELKQQLAEIQDAFIQVVGFKLFTWFISLEQKNYLQAIFYFRLMTNWK